VSPLLVIGYILFSGVAVALLAWLMHALGHSKTFTLSDAETVSAAFLKECPDTEIQQHAIGANGMSALVQLAKEEGFGLVRAVGRFALARQFSAKDIKSLRRDNAELKIEFRDFADPSFRIILESADEARYWADLLDHEGSA
jgi:hypothetical protein